MRKRIYVNLNDTVIVSLRDFEPNKGDIIHKYTINEVNKLIKMKLIPNSGVLDIKDEVHFDIGESDVSDNEEMKETLQKVNSNYFDYNMIPSFSDNEEILDENDDVDIDYL